MADGTAPSTAAGIANRMRDNYGISVQGRDIRDSVLRFQVVNHFGDGGRRFRPRPASLLVDRVDEFDRMWRAVQQWRSVVTLIAVTGPAGAGATVIGEMLLHEIEHHEPDRFPGGVRVIDVRRRSAAQLSWDLLADLGVAPGDTPLDAESRLRRYREVTRAKGAMALLLDNVESIGSVERLIPAAPGSVVLLTAKGRIDDVDRGSPQMAGVSPLCEIPIGALSADSAAELLRLCLARTPESAELTAARARELVSGTDRFPLTVVVRAQGGAHGVDSGTGADSGSARPHPVPAEETMGMDDAVAASYARLSAAQATLLRRLAHHPPGAFAGELAVALQDGADLDTAAVDALCDSGLVERSRSGGRDRFAVGGVVRAEMVRRSRRHDAGEASEARTAIGAYYLRLARGAHARLLPDRWLVDGTVLAPDVRFRDVPAALECMEAERVNLVLMVEAAFEAGDFSLVCALCEALWAFFFRRSCYPDWIRTHELAVRAARSLGEPGLPMLSRMLVQLARPYAEKIGEETASGGESHRDRAFGYTEEAAETAQRSGHDLATLTALEALGKLYEADGALEPAVRLHGRALAIAERLDPPDRRAVMNARHQVGRVELALGDLDRAEATLPAALDAADTLPNPDDYNTARIRTSIAELYQAKGDLAAAVAHLDGALALHDAAGDGKRTADVLVKRARANRGVRDAQARDDLARAVLVYTVIGHEQEAGRAAGLLRSWDEG